MYKEYLIEDEYEIYIRKALNEIKIKDDEEFKKIRTDIKEILKRLQKHYKDELIKIGEEKLDELIKDSTTR
ncbi:MAG: hypothetical protein [Microvirus sp.]|nr:MAG: hypothetical protein [Microvirus sp.]